MEGELRKSLFDRTGLKSVYEARRPSYEAVLQALQRKLRASLEARGKSSTIKYRVKGFGAYFDKLLRISRRKKEGQGAVITDILGLRIVCPFLEDLETVERLIVEEFEVVETERKGDRHSFREFGYDSVHLLVRVDPDLVGPGLPHTEGVCEIQLRTILQDAWAEVEHELIYKSDISLPNESIKRKLASLNASLTLSDLIFQEIRDYQKEIRERDRKRRQSLEVQVGSFRALEQAPPAEKKEKSPPVEPVSIVGQRDLERAMLLALEAHSGGELERAIGLYTQILRLKLDDSVRALVYNHRGMAYFGLSDYGRATRDFTKAIGFDGERNHRCYNNRGLVFRVLKKYDRSLEDYDRSLAIDPSQLDGYWGRSQTFHEMKLYTRALADCEKVLAIEADFQPAQALIRRIASEAF